MSSFSDVTVSASGALAGPDSLARLCDDDVFDCAALTRCLEVNRAWGTASAVKMAYASWTKGSAAAC